MSGQGKGDKSSPDSKQGYRNVRPIRPGIAIPDGSAEAQEIERALDGVRERLRAIEEKALQRLAEHKGPDDLA